MHLRISASFALCQLYVCKQQLRPFLCELIYRNVGFDVLVIKLFTFNKTVLQKSKKTLQKHLDKEVTIAKF